MTLETFFDKFDQFADAPNAVAKMRALVLELAVRGKLVEQAGGGESLTEAQRHGGAGTSPRRTRRARREENSVPLCLCEKIGLR